MRCACLKSLRRPWILTPMCMSALWHFPIRRRFSGGSWSIIRRMRSAGPCPTCWSMPRTFPLRGSGSWWEGSGAWCFRPMWIRRPTALSPTWDLSRRTASLWRRRWRIWENFTGWERRILTWRGAGSSATPTPTIWRISMSPSCGCRWGRGVLEGF